MGYLFALTDAAGEELSRLIETDTPDVFERAIWHEPGGTEQETTKQALVQARKGQGLFRERLDTYWSERCALAEINRRELLRASHIKPWASSNHAERLDTFNGLLLSVAYDAAFDALLLTFDHNGQVVLSPDLDQGTAALLGIDGRSKLRRLDQCHQPYLSDHRARFSERHERRTAVA